MQKRRVVVTGMGCLTPIGNTVDSFWESLLAGKSGASTITTFDVTDMPVKFSASVKNFEVDKYLDTKEQRKMDLFLQYGMAAAIDAVKDSGIDSDKINLEKVGVSIGSGIGWLKYIEDTRSVYEKEGARKISPFFVPASIINMIS